MTETLELENVEQNEECICPECGAKRKIDGSYGWWIYSTGKWACDCGADGTAWYSGDEVSTLA
jgi:phage/plasmid primase-like uncharacterized protein